MDAATFETWLGRIAGLNEAQRRRAFEALALSEAGIGTGIERGDPGPVERSWHDGDAVGSPPATPPKPATIADLGRQRLAATGWAREHAVRLADEVVFMDVRTDRATDCCKYALLQARQKCPDPKPLLLYVGFEEVNLWRHNPHIQRAAEGMGFEAFSLSPAPITIRGQLFDPIEHFRRWRRVDEVGRADIRRKAAFELERVNAAFPDGEGRNFLIADALNERGVRTVTGVPWTAEGVRKTLSRRSKSPDAD